MIEFNPKADIKLENFVMQLTSEEDSKKIILLKYLHERKKRI